ncbi:hypothetical protein conserved [Leishmania donovani]|uniref:Uncharacterized protein n=3 Tax=Leishmania donovani species complex TaxID=38574 RepID=E9AHZ0_LEIIN|nr:conserved hypothetical protein [Leishmania infantum JPCM5]XP_003865800.1 hypothetical protein, conserved [Leishmania donovani]CAC9553334.1 hypothetical_protein_-_conserved [Leishmania infantum]AYU84094.1 hypothetical protein LdCL_360081400 [Leishmania donovani]TPP49482.1 hypothetical protein CGC20_18795 [Leishmania donovani]TPP53350.1 hypothetical protein CGC21_38670 [Leishmania donovani]CAJ1994074.1 hypothetical protein conserved [Leishmania donovani]|eukprot:XP_003392841.1 conserved hypothetical protein [Leishmania infantum JPCM5]
MSGGSGAQGHFMIGKGNGPTSFNWHGSVPTVMVDNCFEPNFRQFDFFLENNEVPNAGLVERVFKPEDGESHWNLRTIMNTNARCTPVLVTSLFGATFVNFLYTRLLNKTGTSVRWSFWTCFAAMLVWNNFTKFVARERYFQRDFQRNQLYSHDELRHQRDQQRVREALYEKNFVTNPVAEYRIKMWQVADRFA